MKISEYKTVIIGSGIAGLYSALRIAEKQEENNGIALITKATLEEGNSNYAQGGIVGIMPENESDSITLHVEDTLKAGAGLTNERVATYISKQSSHIIEELLNYGVDFDKDEADNLKFTMEGAHSVKRILHAGGDATGRKIEHALAEDICSHSNIHIYENTMAVEIIKDSFNRACGVIAFNHITEEYEAILSNHVIIATGGAGQVYKNTTNPTVTTGDGIALAWRAGAKLTDMEFVQFHPTAFAKGIDKLPLISEAVRGEGAKLKLSDGSTFMEKYDERQELASRDIVTRAIFNEMKENNLENVYLDSTLINPQTFINRFPTIMKICTDAGINPLREMIPVRPAAHYLMGGVKTNIQGETNIKGLYVIGETACTGLHGANRLASNSLLECAVLAYSVSELINNHDFDAVSTNIENQDYKIIQTINKYEREIEFNDVDFVDLKNSLQEQMWKNVGIIRNENSLVKAIKSIRQMEAFLGYKDKCPSKEAYEIRNMLIVANNIVRFALKRKESRGAHYRSDYTGKHEPAYHLSKTINQTEFEVYYD